jgi:hypothetical protein
VSALPFVRRWSLALPLAIVALVPATADGAILSLRPDAEPGPDSGWAAVPSGELWRAVDDPITHRRNPPGRGHLRPRAAGATTVIGLERRSLDAANVNAGTAWIHADTRPGTQLRVELRWRGRTTASRTIRSQGPGSWRRIPLELALPRSQQAVNSLELRLRAIGGRDARVDAAYLRLHTAAFGFNEAAFLAGPDDEAPDAREVLDLVASGGGPGSVLRFPLDWRSVQGNPPQESLPPERWAWVRYDELYAAAREAKVRLLPVLIGAPGWAREGSGCDGILTHRPVCPPDAEHLDAWARFAGAAASRYPESLAIEIWNEPNYRGFWRLGDDSAPSGAHYAVVFNAAAAAIDAADPTQRIVIGSIGPDAQIGAFVDAFYDYVDRRLLDRRDGLGFHPYQEAPGVATPSWDQIRSVVRRRDPGRGLWLTEFGVKTAGTDAVTEIAQSRLLLDQLRGELLADPSVEATLIHRLVDIASPDPGEQGFGVINLYLESGLGLVPKLAFCRLAVFQGQPRPASC